MKKLMGVLIVGMMSMGLMAVGASVVKAAEQVAAQAVDAGNKVCPVMGGEASPSITVEYKGKIYHLCCPGCKKSFEQDPERFSKIADDEVAVQKAE